MALHQLLECHRLHVEGTRYIDGAPQEGSPLQRLQDDLVEVCGGLAQVVPLCDPPGEILEALRGAAARQRFIAPIHLGVGFLQQSTPEFGALGGVDEEQFAILGGQVIVHHHVLPLTKLPDLEVEDPGVAVLEALPMWHHTVQDGLIQR